MYLLDTNALLFFLYLSYCLVTKLSKVRIIAHRLTEDKA